MDPVIYFLVSIILFIAIARHLTRHRRAKRESLIDSFCFPDTIAHKVAAKYPHLSEREIDRVMAGLREYFHICNVAGRRMVAMPSQAVDVAWHEFILFTRQYRDFCQSALGRFLHHTPAEAMTTPTQAQTGLKRAWKLSCRREDIAPKAPARLPLLFAMDGDLDIPDGYKYSVNCASPGSHPYCAGSIGCGGCGGGCSGDSGCSGGCGGD